ncbi:MAG: oligogalacturonide lyase [Candidatus Latescibacteria bacterium]|nr:oligogalacturonide lyase [Candidatus Latescibacterota bacterium]
MTVGRLWETEISRFEDPDTGVSVQRLTAYRGHSHHFYFTNNGWYDNGRRLLLSSDRENCTNLFSLELDSGQLLQLTNLEPLPLPREVEFLRACLNSQRSEAYFWYGLELMALDLETLQQRVLYTMPTGWDVSMINCSADGRHLYASLSEDMSDRFRVDYMRGYVGFRETWAAKPQSRIVQVAVDGGAVRTVWEEQYWIGHVNTSPTQSDILTFCHEGPWKDVDNRIWGLEIASGRVWTIRAREEDESVGHEYWHADGVRVGYHGRHPDGRQFLGHTRYDDSDRVEVSFPGQTGHIHSNDPQLIVGDGGRVVRLWQWNGSGYEGPRVLCRHDSSMKIQQLHVHPRFSLDGGQVLFTSDVSGYGDVYLAQVADFAGLPAVDG